MKTKKIFVITTKNPKRKIEPNTQAEWSMERTNASEKRVRDLVDKTWIRVNDPSAGSPTETLLRLLLPLNDQV
jgi:hypothetical protein